MDIQVLLVDDDPCTLETVAFTLQHYLPALTIESCQSAVSALSKLRQQSFAVVLSDFKMPEMNGLSLLRATRECGCDASFLLMTGASTEDMLVEGLRLGMFALVGETTQPCHIHTPRSASHRVPSPETRSRGAAADGPRDGQRHTSLPRRDGTSLSSHLALLIVGS